MKALVNKNEKQSIQHHYFTNDVRDRAYYMAHMAKL